MCSLRCTLYFSYAMYLIIFAQIAPHCSACGYGNVQPKQPAWLKMHDLRNNFPLYTAIKLVILSFEYLAS